MTQLEKNFLDFALAECGAPYIWGGKGNKLFDTAKGLIANPFKDRDEKAVTVLDCSGLITWALYLATDGRVDLRASHSAKTIFDTFPEHSASSQVNLYCYSHHVAVEISHDYDIVLDANKGDENCTTILHAQQRGAKVEVHRNVRSPAMLLGYRRIPVDLTELRKV